jgi:hypothetical protein
VQQHLQLCRQRQQQHHQLYRQQQQHLQLCKHWQQHPQLCRYQQQHLQLFRHWQQHPQLCRYQQQHLHKHAGVTSCPLSTNCCLSCTCSRMVQDGCSPATYCTHSSCSRV